MQELPVLAIELQRLLTKTGYSRQALLDRAEGRVRPVTLHRWITGSNATANNPEALLAIADVLGLNRVETDRLARIAGQESLEHLLHAAGPSERQRLAMRWNVPYRNSLPAGLSSFIGRVEAVRDVSERLGVWGDRLVTLYGPAGSGKTRLALEAATRLRDAFRDGLFFVRLADITSPDEIAPAILRVLGVTPLPDTPPLERLLGVVRDRRLLLLLDNFEHLLDARLIVSELREAAANLQILVTSREALELIGEVRYPVEPLNLPAEDAPWRIARATDAVALFQERAGAVRPNFRVTAANAAAVTQLCRSLDGLPLAIELVAARSDSAEPAGLLETISGPALLDTPGPRDAAQRQATLRAAIDWSYRLLPAQDAALFDRLSVFAGGWTIDDARAVCAAPGQDITSVLERLQHSNLINRTGDTDTGRWSMLVTLRAFAQEQLVERGETDAISRRHAEQILSIAAGAGPYYPQANQGPWMDRLEPERANIDAALTWATTHDPDLALRLATALWPFWHEYEHVPDGIRWLPGALAAVSEPDLELRANALTGVQFLRYSVGNYVDAITIGEEALATWRDLNNPHGQGLTLIYLGLAHGHLGAGADSFASIQRALHAFESSGDQLGTACALANMGQVLFLGNQITEAEQCFTQAEQLYRALGEEIGLMRIGTDRGLLAILSNRPHHAIPILRDTLALTSRARLAGIRPAVELYLGVAYFLTNRLDDAEELQRRSIRTNWEIGALLMFSFNVLAFAAIAIRRALLLSPDDPARRPLAERSAILAGAGSTYLRQLQYDAAVSTATYTAELAKTQQELDPAAFAEAFGFGSRLGPATAYGMVIIAASDP